MSKFFLSLRYISGGLFALFAISQFYGNHHLAILLSELIVSAFLVLPPSLKFSGYTGILGDNLNTRDFFTPHVLFSICRWTLGFFYSVGAIAMFESKGNMEGVICLIAGVPLISPLDRFIFAPVSSYLRSTWKNYVLIIYLLRNYGIFMLFLAPPIYDSNNVVAYCMIILGIGMLVYAGLMALKLPQLIMTTTGPVSENVGNQTYDRIKATTLKTLMNYSKAIKKLFTITLPPRPVKPIKQNEPKPASAPKPEKKITPPKHKVPKYHDAYVMRWKLKPSNTTNAFFQELIQHFQQTWLAANEYDERLKMHRNKEEHKEQTVRVLTDYIEEISGRNAMIDTINGKVVSVPEQVSEIWRADKRLRSLFSAMEKYSKQRGAKKTWIIMVHVAEYRAMINLVKRIKHSQVKELSPVLIKRSQEALAQSNLYSSTDKLSLLDLNTYFKIIDYIILLGKNLESYKDLNDKFNEERYRDYFLPFLNAVNPAYSAKGEVFNRQGKTDILICDNKGNNIFIAECKLWRGEAYLIAAVDQLLQNYVNWRDEKTAIIIFNREMKQFSRLILTATEVMSRHPLCLRAAGMRAETSWSYLFRHPDDDYKVIRLELVLFNFA